MKVPSKKNRNLISELLGTLFSFGLFMYFGFHLMHGDMGYFALRGVNLKLSEIQQKHDYLLVERVALENRVKRLRPQNLDLDMLDERARVVLGFLGPNDRVILEK